MQLVPKVLLVSAVQLERRAPLDNRVSRVLLVPAVQLERRAPLVLPAQLVFKEQQVCIIMIFRG